MPPDLFEQFRRHIAWTSDTPLGLVVDRAEGPYIYLKDGRRIVDMISGIAVSSIGHGDPRVRNAVRRQIDRYMHVMVYGEFVQEPQVRLAALLTSELPEALQVVYFTNSGTEANEGALKIAKKFTGRAKMVAFDGSYHGDTQGSLSVTGRSVYRDPFAPLLPGVTFLPFNADGPLEAIDNDTACVITEPIQGEGGVNVPSPSWLKSLRRRCSEVGALLIFDEVQTGMGRTGSLFAFQRVGVTPDVLTLAKAFGGGLPLGAFVSSAEILGSIRRDPPLSHVTTFGGHPVSCAAAHAALSVLLEEDLPSRALEIERRVKDRLKHPLIDEVRGAGAILGLLLRDADTTARTVQACLDAGILLGWTLHSNRLIRIAPPLNIPWEVLDNACGQIQAALSIVAQNSRVD